MSALRIPGPDGRIVLVPVDDGMTPYRKSTHIGGTLVAERPFYTISAGIIPPSRLAQMAEYRATHPCGKAMPKLRVPCARRQGHGGACLSRKSLDERTARKAVR